ncbi:hypothetical protein SIAM614_20430 [Stappia aggregata IAM 12614]|uniref:Uncharacterized protein n=1 Tax=Roseibium aggregatum (strain ATCC 25650 / DSM 13394 / JCM 20685 / NBRC 16684 / NCIMB 2208 / IAM 12614 / B1) TaxID=384765 RepID=A0NY97_ROSAI|nr:hypothetical protein SIAM614_20430 [Stappia aggregata IAM 12614] [Roseibium aggregatum IAM 12614]
MVSPAESAATGSEPSPIDASDKVNAFRFLQRQFRAGKAFRKSWKFRKSAN